MAQTGYTPISLYYTTTASAVPTAGNLVAGELAINTLDGKLFYKDSAGVVQVLAGKGGAGVAGGSNTQVQYNSSGSLAGSANMTFSGTALTLANDASISGLTVGKGGGAVGGNTAVGIQALNSNTSANYNTAVGYQAGYTNSTGISNSYFGALSGKLNTGTRNTAIGTNSFSSSGAGGSNTATGTESLAGNTSGSYNSAFGDFSLYSNTTASFSAALGYQALYLNTTGTLNTAVGSVALNQNTTGGYNVAVGSNALYSNTTASNNTAVGYQAGFSNTTGSENTFVGLGAGYTNTTGNGLTYVGRYAGYVATGIYNQFFGYGAGSTITTGAKNTILGRYDGNYGGLDIRTASNYIVLSDGDGNPRQVIDNTGKVLINTSNNTSQLNAAGSVGAWDTTNNIKLEIQAASNTGYINMNGTGPVYMRMGSGFTAVGNFSNSTGVYTPTSDINKKKDFEPSTLGLSAILQLKPTLFRMKTDNESSQKTLGFIAQEVKDVIPQAYVENQTEDVDGNSESFIGLQDRPIVAVLVKAIQELNAKVTALEAQLGK